MASIMDLDPTQYACSVDHNVQATTVVHTAAYTVDGDLADLIEFACDAHVVRVQRMVESEAAQMEEWYA